MTPKERINGIFNSQDLQIRFLQWFLGFMVSISALFSGLSYNRIDQINDRYINLKLDNVDTEKKIIFIDERVKNNTIRLDSLCSRLSFIEVSFEKMKEYKQSNN